MFDLYVFNSFDDTDPVVTREIGFSNANSAKACSTVYYPNGYLVLVNRKNGQARFRTTWGVWGAVRSYDDTKALQYIKNQFGLIIRG